MKTKIKRIYAIAALAVILFAITFHDRPWLLTLGTVELVGVGLVVNTFVFVYYQRNWKANPYGRALMYSKVSLAALADMTILTAFMGADWEYRAALRFILFAGILVAQVRLLQLLYSLENKEARDTYRGLKVSDGKEL